MIVLQNCTRTDQFYPLSRPCPIADDIELICQTGYPIRRNTYFLTRGIRLPILSRFEPGTCIVFARDQQTYNELQTHEGSIFFVSNGNMPVPGSMVSQYGTYITDACMSFNGNGIVALEEHCSRLLGLR